MIYENYPQKTEALCIIVHGMGEHAKRYETLIKAFEKASIKAYAFDLPFHGMIESSGIFEKINEETYLKMIHTQIQSLLENYEKVPKTLMGHSMGSLIARRYAQLYPNEFSHMIWMGTMPIYPLYFSQAMRFVSSSLSLFYPSKKRHKLLAKLMNQSLNKTMPKGASPYAWLSYNEQNVKEYMEDPYSGYAYNGIFYRFFFELMDHAHRKHNLKKTSLSHVFLISGEDDPVTNGFKSFENILKTYDQLGVRTTFETMLIKAMRHELLHEDDSVTVTNELIKRILR
jgi:alpha-beta hydrolase superfamily lysophospholipase